MKFNAVCLLLLAASSPARAVTVETVADAHNWVSHGIDVVRARLAPCQDIAGCLRNLQYSTAFSGIDAPGTALSWLSHGAGVESLEHVWACEQSMECIYELKMHRHPPIHLLESIEGILNPRIRNILSNACNRLPFEDLKKLLATGRMATLHGACSQHPGRACSFGRACIHIAGMAGRRGRQEVRGMIGRGG